MFVHSFPLVLQLCDPRCGANCTAWSLGSETISIPNATLTTRHNASGVAARRITTMKGSDILVESKCCGTRGREETLKLFLFRGGISGSASWKRCGLEHFDLGCSIVRSILLWHLKNVAELAN